MKNKVYIGSIVLERNRWSSKVPTYRVSEWLDRFREDGFDGLELWENHVLLADGEEAERIAASGFPVAIFNTYNTFDDDEESVRHRQKVIEAIRKLNAGAVKFNLGEEKEKMDIYLKNLLSFSQQLPENCVMLCECHPETVLEEFEVQKKVFAQLDPKRFQIIVHGLLDAELPQKLLWFGDRISHVHLQLRDENNRFVRMEKKPQIVERAFELLGSAAPDCSFTVEFTEGCALPEEKIETVYQNAVSDKNVIKKYSK